MRNAQDHLAALVIERWWRRRRWIAALAIVLSIIGFGVAYQNPIFHSEAILQLVGVSPIDYKRYSPNFNSLAVLDAFLAARRDTAMPAAARLREQALRHDGLSSFVEPLFPVSKDGQREILESTKEKESLNSMVGARVTYSDSSSELAQQGAVLLGEFVADALLVGRLDDLIRMKVGSLATDIRKSDNRILETKFDLEQLNRKRAAILAIKARYPDASRGERQIVSLQENGHRYLPPVSQIVGIEAQIADLDSVLSAETRTRDINSLLASFYTKGAELLKTPRSGEQLLMLLDDAKAQIFANADRRQEWIREADNQATIDLLNVRTSLRDRVRFVGPPIVGRSQQLRTAVFASLLVFIIVVAAVAITILFQIWWQSVVPADAARRSANPPM